MHIKGKELGMKPLYWLTTAALDHVNIVKQKGYTQVNMGPKEPLELMHPGDLILYYSPTTCFEEPDSVCQQFTGISRISDHNIYPQDPDNPVRWRRNAQFFECVPHHAEQFHQQVDFLKQHENWLDAFLKPVFEISQQDFMIIAKQILIPSQFTATLF